MQSSSQISYVTSEHGVTKSLENHHYIDRMHMSSY